jgi:acetylornithine deacetylase/succinyl-diaminopimelate desuccinylase-like protein
MIKAERLLRELIALPSVNPAFLPERHPNAGERKVADFLAATAAKEGLDIDLREVLPGRSNLMVRFQPKNETRVRILLAPHLDTVNAGEKQFTPRTRNGRLYGRGACDTKGSVAAMFAALCDVANAKARPSATEIVFAGLIDEEQAQAGSRALANSGCRFDLAIVGEATNEKVVTAHKGSLWLQLETHGKSAHGARPELGRNAILEMSKVVRALEEEYGPGLRGRRHPLLGCATSSVGTIRGGSQPNIVPDRCAVEMDRRTLPGESEPGVVRELNAFLKARGFRVQIESSKLAPCLPMETDARLPLVKDLLIAAGQRRPMGVHYFCDASVLSRAGIPSVVFGPGDIAQAHTQDEWIALPSLERATAILRRFLEGLP